MSSRSRSASRLGIDQFRLNPLPQRRLDRATGDQIHRPAEQLLESFRESDEAEADRRIDFHQNIDIALSRNFRRTCVGAKEREALQGLGNTGEVAFLPECFVEFMVGSLQIPSANETQIVNLRLL